MFSEEDSTSGVNLWLTSNYCFAIALTDSIDVHLEKVFLNMKNDINTCITNNLNKIKRTFLFYFQKTWQNIQLH